ncbi:MAG: glycosyltransferase family 4 protein [Polyangiaceae bacterium]|nr:glycosyltransferase family 4 protein [Polyangiaceae bacterium]
MTTDTVGGVWSFALELAGALAGLGVQTALAAMGGPPTPAGRAAARAIPGLELFESSYRVEWMDDPWDDVAAAGAWLLDLEARLRPDVIHLNGYCHGALPWRAPVVITAHSCVLSWWRAVLGEDAPARYDRYRAEVARGLRAARVIAAPTAAMLADLVACHGAACSGGAAARVIPNGRDRSRFRPATMTPASRERFIFSAGRLWDTAKNLTALAVAAPRISWPIIVAGSDEHPGANGDARMIQAAEGHPVRTLGWLEPDELARWMGRAAIYAMPARYEPFGLSILEAGLSGCALLLGDIPSLREVWGDAALFAPPGDPGAIAAAAQRLIDDAGLRAALGARARRRAARFTPRATARRYLDAYRDAAAPLAATDLVAITEDPCV